MWPWHCNFFSWCYTWLDVIYILGVVLVWFVVMSLLSSWDEMDVSAELLADHVWSDEDDKTGFFIFVVDSLDQLYLKNNQFSCP